MTPRLAHGFLYVKHLEPMISFYEHVLGFVTTRSSHPGFVTMTPGHGLPGLALHVLPDAVAAEVHLTTPPREREDAAIKLCFTVTDLEAARAAVVARGGLAREPWTWEGVTYCECCDPEGNVLQLLVR
ncbi:MAG: VOC family protein [Myxococcota bacterium]